MMSSNEEESASNDEQLSSPASPMQPMSTDWSNTMTMDTAQEVSAGATSNGSLHESLHELSPIWADSGDLIGDEDTLSVAPGDLLPIDAAFASTSSSNRHAAAATVGPTTTSKPTLPLISAAASTSGTIVGTMPTFGPMESFEEKTPLELPTKTRLKVRIKRLNIVGAWRWVDGKEDACGICRTPFETCCMDCKFPGDECPLVLGQCKHPFHMHCIVKWTNTQSGQKPACPLCRQEWKFATS